MFGWVKAEWQRFSGALPGERFIEYHEHHRARTPEALLALMYFATVFCVGMSIVLWFVSGPAWIYWLLSAVLLPLESRKAAVAFDHIERAVHRVFSPRTHHRGLDGIEDEIPPSSPRPRPMTDAAWLNARAGGAPGAARRARTPIPAPIDRRTPTPT